jgi:hypothetical protein
VYEIGSCLTVSLAFDNYFDDAPTNSFDRGELYISVDGFPWFRLEVYDVTGFFEETVDLTPYLAGGADFQLRFRFLDETGANYGWYIDNVRLSGSR